MGVYKYLSEKLEESHGEIQQLTVLAIERMKERAQRDGIIEDFLCTNDEPSDICKVFGFKQEDAVYDLIESEIEDEAFVHLVCKHGRDGYLAEVQYNQPSKIYFNDDGTASGWTNSAISSVVWLYADTLGELVEKSIEKGEELFSKWCEKEKEKEEKEKENKYEAPN